MSKVVYKASCWDCQDSYKQSEGCMTEKLNILGGSQVPVMHLLLQTTSRQLVTTSNGTTLRYWQKVGLIPIVRLRRLYLFRNSNLPYAIMSVAKSFIFISLHLLYANFSQLISLLLLISYLYFVSTSQRMMKNTANRQISLFGEGLARTNPNTLHQST